MTDYNSPEFAARTEPPAAEGWLASELLSLRDENGNYVYAEADYEIVLAREHDAYRREDAAALAVAQARIVTLETALRDLVSIVDGPYDYDAVSTSGVIGKILQSTKRAKDALAGIAPPPADDGLRDRVETVRSSLVAGQMYWGGNIRLAIEAALRGETP